MFFCWCADASIPSLRYFAKTDSSVLVSQVPVAKAITGGKNSFNALLANRKGLLRKGLTKACDEVDYTTVCYGRRTTRTRSLICRSSKFENIYIVKIVAML